MPEHEPSEQGEPSSAKLLADIKARFEARLSAKRDGGAVAAAQVVSPGADLDTNQPVEEPNPSAPGASAVAELAADVGIAVTNADLDDTGVRHAEGTPPPAPTNADALAEVGEETAVFPAVADAETGQTLAAPSSPPDPTPEDIAKQESKTKIFEQVADFEKTVDALAAKYTESYELRDTAELIKADLGEIYDTEYFPDEDEAQKLGNNDYIEVNERLNTCYEKIWRCALKVFGAIEQRKNELNDHFVFSREGSPQAFEYLHTNPQIHYPALMSIGTFDPNPTSTIGFKSGRSELSIVPANEFPAFAGSKVKQAAIEKFAGMRIRETGEEATAEQKIEYLIGVVKAINAQGCNLVLGKNQHTEEITLTASDYGLNAKYEDDNVRVDSQEDLSLAIDDRDWRVEPIAPTPDTPANKFRAKFEQLGNNVYENLTVDELSEIATNLASVSPVRGVDPSFERTATPAQIMQTNLRHLMDSFVNNKADSLVSRRPALLRVLRSVVASDAVEITPKIKGKAISILCDKHNFPRDDLDADNSYVAGFKESLGHGFMERLEKIIRAKPEGRDETSDESSLRASALVCYARNMEASADGLINLLEFTANEKGPVLDMAKRIVASDLQTSTDFKDKPYQDRMKLVVASSSMLTREKLGVPDSSW